MTPTHTLPPRPTLPAAEAFLAEMRETSAAPVIDASTVEDLPTAFVLALTAVGRALGEHGDKISVIRPSAGFVDAFSDLGLFQDLMKMEFCQ